MSASSRRVLVLDDSPLVLEAMREGLEGAGFDVRIANNLTEFEEHCRVEHDLILIDVQMPEAFGDELAMMMRQGLARKGRIYLLSSLSDDELRGRATDAEIDGFISKRWGLERVVERVKEIVGAS